MTHTHPVVGYLFPSDDPDEVDEQDLAHFLAEMEELPGTDAYDEAVLYYESLPAYELIGIFRSRTK